MDQAAKVAFINSQIVCAQVRLAGMLAANKEAESFEYMSPKYNEYDFTNLTQLFGLEHNQVLNYLGE